MTSQANIVAESPAHFFSIASTSMRISDYPQLCSWLQGDLQYLLPHDALLVAHGDISKRNFNHELISKAGVVAGNACTCSDIEGLIVGLFHRWQRYGSNIYSLATTSSVILNSSCQCELHRKLRGMRSVMVQGIRDERDGSDQLYILLRARGRFDDAARRMFDMLLPHIDCSVRRVTTTTDAKPSPASAEKTLTRREAEIMRGVGNGKTNGEIGTILGISPFTVKNHLRRIFRKIDVSNRAHAVSRFEALDRQRAA